MNLTDIYRIFHPTAPQYTFFSEACGERKEKDTNKKDIKFSLFTNDIILYLTDPKDSTKNS
jgi:exonuclease III